MIFRSLITSTKMSKQNLNAIFVISSGFILIIFNQMRLKWSKIYQKASICPPSRSKHYKGQWRPQQKNICIFPHCWHSEEGISRTGTQNLTIIKLMFSEKATSKITQLVLTGFFASHQFRTNVELSFFIFDNKKVGFSKKVPTPFVT